MAEPVQEQLKDSADQTKAAAQSTAHAAERTKDSADRRTVFAAERTYAAWVRTGFVALASGVGARKLLEGVVPGWMIVATGTALVLLSAFASSPVSGGSSSLARCRPTPTCRVCRPLS